MDIPYGLQYRYKHLNDNDICLNCAKILHLQYLSKD